MCASPVAWNVEETVSTLRFATRAKTVKTSVKLNVVRSRKELEMIIDQLRKEVAELKGMGKGEFEELPDVQVAPEVTRRPGLLRESVLHKFSFS